jgi:hypothetical protein
MTRRDSPDLRFDQAARPRLVGRPIASGVARMPFRCPESGLASLSRSRAPHANRLWPRPKPGPRPGRRSAQLAGLNCLVPALERQCSARLAGKASRLAARRMRFRRWRAEGPVRRASPGGSEQSEPGRSHGERASGSRATHHLDRHAGVQPPGSAQQPPQGPRVRRVGGQAQLLRHHGLGRSGGELRHLPAKGAARGDRRPPRVARVGAAGRLGQAAGFSIVAERVQFLGTRKVAEGDGLTTPGSDVPADTADFDQAAAGGGFAADDDLPF